MIKITRKESEQFVMTDGDQKLLGRELVPITMELGIGYVSNLLFKFAINSLSLFEMKKIVAKIKVVPTGPSSANISIDMPIWTTKTEDGKLLIQLALLGDFVTVAKNEADIDEAVKEAVESFILAADNHGKGFRAELQLLGWEQKNSNMRYRVERNRQDNYQVPGDFYIPKGDALRDNLLRTSTQKSVQLEMA